MDQGKITWTYGYYRYRVFGETRTKDLIIYYNPDGTVSSYTFNTSFPEEKNVVARPQNPLKTREGTMLQTRPQRTTDIDTEQVRTGARNCA